LEGTLFATVAVTLEMLRISKTSFMSPWKKFCGRPWGGTNARQKRKMFFIKQFTLTTDQILIVLLKHI